MPDQNNDRFKAIELLNEVEKIISQRKETAADQWDNLKLSVDWLILLNHRMGEISAHCVDMHFRSVPELDPETAFLNVKKSVLNLAATCIEMINNLEQARCKDQKAKDDLIEGKITLEEFLTEE